MAKQFINVADGSVVGVGVVNQRAKRTLMMTSGGNRVELQRSKLGDGFAGACDQLRVFAKKNYVTLQDDLSSVAPGP